MGIFGFHRKRLEPRVLPWQQHTRCHSISFMMYIAGAKFEEHCFNIFRVTMTSSLVIQKRKDLQNEKRYAEKENAILLYPEKLFK